LAKWSSNLEALDRDFRKANERPSIGVIALCLERPRGREYALARSVSPALIAEYQTALPDKQLLRRKLHEFYLLARPHAAPGPRKPDIGSHAKETTVPSRNMGKPARS